MKTTLKFAFKDENGMENINILDRLRIINKTCQFKIELINYHSFHKLLALKNIKATILHKNTFSTTTINRISIDILNIETLNDIITCLNIEVPNVHYYTSIQNFNVIKNTVMYRQKNARIYP